MRSGRKLQRLSKARHFPRELVEASRVHCKPTAVETVRARKGEDIVWSAWKSCSCLEAGSALRAGLNTTEQELQNLLIANSPDELKRLLRIYASDDQSREGAIAELLTREDPFSSERVEAQGSGITRPTAGLMALLESIGLELVFDNETQEENHEQEIPDPSND